MSIPEHWLWFVVVGAHLAWTWLMALKLHGQDEGLSESKALLGWRGLVAVLPLILGPSIALGLRFSGGENRQFGLLAIAWLYATGIGVYYLGQYDYAQKREADIDREISRLERLKLDLQKREERRWAEIERKLGAKTPSRDVEDRRG